MKRTIKISLDVLLFLIVTFNFIPTEIVWVQLHFIVGLVFMSCVIVHILLNGKWCVSVTKALVAGKVHEKIKRQYATNWLLLVNWLLVVLSGILAMGYSMGEVEFLIVFKYLHIAFAVSGTLLIIRHLLQHKNQIRSYFKGKTQMPLDSKLSQRNEQKKIA